MFLSSTKKCSHCKQEKNTVFFNKNKSTKDNLHNMCKQCVSDRYFINREKRSLDAKKRREKNKEKEKEKRFLYKSKNRKILSEKQKIYYLNNIQERLEYAKNYRKFNNKKIQEYRKTQEAIVANKNSNHKRRTKLKQGDVTSQQLLELQQNAKVCYWCGDAFKNKIMHIDHYIPLSKGGEHTLSNLVVSCEKCNLTKHTKDPIQFANSIGKLL